jgi:hypothetical protein
MQTSSDEGDVEDITYTRRMTRSFTSNATGTEAQFYSLPGTWNLWKIPANKAALTDSSERRVSRDIPIQEREIPETPQQSEDETDEVDFVLGLRSGPPATKRPSTPLRTKNDSSLIVILKLSYASQVAAAQRKLDRRPNTWATRRDGRTHSELERIRQSAAERHLR